ncbi:MULTISPECIES: hypothetical protein [Burkholderiaceae]|uniref:Uncharacterized protein n=1 Tax=Caballeronia sordidicola TaxID=196367 RepID=A0A242MZ18_CABSO|nr:MULTISPECIES: hypothetical protein [Burkholderiaceae]AME23285.1 hypothetical protein AXG89_04985 [Burkholderia sp. PAMC 26561]MDP9155194.1 hypothetical protein [Pseudomonadota bacterium]OTP76645.1 hypothetical protein PAMC26577_10340 [Caballeronia sordidicola]
MSTSWHLHEQQRRRIHSLIAVTAIAVIVVSGIGIAALTGILSASKAESATSNASPLIDTHSADPLSGLKLNAEPLHGLAVEQRIGISGAR